MSDKDAASIKGVHGSIGPWAYSWPMQSLDQQSHLHGADGGYPTSPPHPMLRQAPSSTNGLQQHAGATHTWSPRYHTLYSGAQAAEGDSFLCRKRDRPRYSEPSRKRRRTIFDSDDVADIPQGPLQKPVTTDQRAPTSNRHEHRKISDIRPSLTSNFLCDSKREHGMSTSHWYSSQLPQGYQYSRPQQVPWTSGKHQQMATYPPTPPYTAGHVTPNDSGYISQTSKAQTPETDFPALGVTALPEPFGLNDNQLNNSTLDLYTLDDSFRQNGSGKPGGDYFVPGSPHGPEQQAVSLADPRPSNNDFSSRPLPPEQDLSLPTAATPEADFSKLDFFEAWDMTMNDATFDSQWDYESLFPELPLDQPLLNQPASMRVAPTKEEKGQPDNFLPFDPCLPGYVGDEPLELPPAHEPSQMRGTMTQGDLLDSGCRSQLYSSFGFPGRDRPGYRDTAMDSLLIKWRNEGMSYKDIKIKGAFIEAESTLRGRYRTLTKPKDERVRKPPWTPEVESLLWESVRPYANDLYVQYDHGSPRGLMSVAAQKGAKVPWKQIAEGMEHCGTYRYGNATVKKKWLELCEKKAAGEKVT